MPGFASRSRSLWFALVALSLVVPLLAACATPAAPAATAVPPAPAPATAAPAAAAQPAVSQFELVRAAADAYLVDDKRAKTPNVAAEDLYMNLNDGDAKNDPFILDVRAAADFAKGHIPNAVNIPWRNTFEPDNLKKLPNDKQIVVYCYTGHTGSQVTALLNAAGFNAINLKHGMSGWTKNTDVAAARWDPEKNQKNYKIDATAVAATQTFAPPALAVSKATDAAQVVRDAAAAYFADDKRAKTPNTSAEDLFMRLNDGDTKNDPVLVSVRGAADYAKGHIPGAINIPWREIAKKENLAKLPTDRQILIYCYTGHTGSQATALLNAMGYNAVNLQYGFCAWSSDKNTATGCIDPAKDFKDYKFVTGS